MVLKGSPWKVTPLFSQRKNMSSDFAIFLEQEEIIVRALAIAALDRINLSERYPKDCELYQYPVFCTQRVWQLITSAVENSEACNDYSGVIWDICYMSLNSPGRKSIGVDTGIEFSVIITGADVQPSYYEENLPIYTLHILCGPTSHEDPTQAMTIMFPDEGY